MVVAVVDRTERPIIHQIQRWLSFKLCKNKINVENKMSMVDKFKAFCGDAVRPDKLKTKSWRKCVGKRNGFTDSVASRTCINSYFAGTDHWTGSIRRNSSQSLCDMFRCSLQIIISQVHRLHLGVFFLFCSNFAYWTCLAYTPLSPSCPHCSWF